MKPKPFEGWVDDPDVILAAIEQATGWNRLYLLLYLGKVMDEKESTK